MKRIRHSVVTIYRDIEVAVIRLIGRPQLAPARVRDTPAANQPRRRS